jgi:hypothetical protein
MSELMHRTGCAVLSKEQLPRSPGLIVEDAPLLCAGAALVYEAARRAVPAGELALIAREMIMCGRKEILRRAEEFSLDAAFVELVVVKNDSYSDWERRDRMSWFLSRGTREFAPV